MHLKQEFAIVKKMDDRGFSLLEVVIALAIFTIGILAIVGLQVTATSGNAKARFATEAAVLARDVVERLMALDYDPAAPSAEFQLGTIDFPDPPGGRYRINYTVSAATTANAVNITVRVRWWAYGIPRGYNLRFMKSQEI